MKIAAIFWLLLPLSAQWLKLPDPAIPRTSDLPALAAAIKALTGVVDHGLFLEQVDTVLLGAPDGSVERLVRP